MWDCWALVGDSSALARRAAAGLTLPARLVWWAFQRDRLGDTGNEPNGADDGTALLTEIRDALLRLEKMAAGRAPPV